VCDLSPVLTVLPLVTRPAIASPTTLSGSDSASAIYLTNALAVSEDSVIPSVSLGPAFHAGVWRT